MFVRENSYEELIFQKIPNYLYIWLSFITLLLVSLIIISCFYKYNKFYEINGLVIEEGSDVYVQILLENDKLDIIKDVDLILNNEPINFTYEVSSYMYSETGSIYREIRLFFENDFEPGEVVSIIFKSPQTTLIKEIKTKIKKGMM